MSRKNGRASSRRPFQVLTASAAVEPTTAVEPTSTVEPATAVEPAATVEPAAVEAFTAKATAVETSAMKAAIKAAMIETAPTETVTIKATVEAAIKEAITVPEAKAPPGSSAKEDAAIEPFRAVIAVGGTGVGIIAVVTIGADRSRAVIGRAIIGAVIDRPSKPDAEGDALGVGVRSREKTNTETNAE
jgi:hypothetical protein